MTTFRRGVLICLLLAATAGCDRVTKHLAVTSLAGYPDHSFLAGTVRLQYHENPGAFLSLGSGWSPAARTLVFQVANGLFLVALVIAATRRRLSWIETCGFTLFLAGSLSNLIDRVAVGGVIDFLNVGIGPVRTGIFNVADVAIMAGVGLLVAKHCRSAQPVSSTR